MSKIIKPIALDETLKRVADAIENQNENKADKSTTLSGYGITDAYTTIETDSKILKAISTEVTNRQSEVATVRSQVGDLTNSFNNIYSISGLSWELGGINRSDGALIDSTTRARTINPISKKVRVLKIRNNYTFCVFAYKPNSAFDYVGIWDGTGFQVSTLYWQTELDLTAIRQNYDYDVFIVIQNENKELSVSEIEVNLELEFEPYMSYEEYVSANTNIANRRIVDVAYRNDVCPVNGKMQNTLNAPNSGMVCFPCQKNTEYHINISGLHNRFVIDGIADTRIVTNTAYDILYNSNKTSQREIEESVTVNSGNYEYLVVFTNYKLECNPVVKVWEDYGDSLTINGFDVLLKDEYFPNTYIDKNDTVRLGTSAEVFELFDSLVTKYPEYVTKNTLTSGDFVNYEYVFTTGNYNAQSGTRSPDAEVEKPIILFTCGTHGYEACSTMSTFSLFKSLSEGNLALADIRENFTIKVIPIVTPYSFDADSRTNENGVNINRNFDANWSESGIGGEDYSGSNAADQFETQVVQNWIDNNLNACYLIDHHNSYVTNEVSYFSVKSDEEYGDIVKKYYRKGINGVSLWWEFGRKIDRKNFIYGYTGTQCPNGSLVRYANKLGIKGSIVETTWEQAGAARHSATSIAIGAEALGAIFIGLKDYLLN